MTEPTQEEITLIAREYNHENKCGMCGHRTPSQWNLGEDEDEELATCAGCAIESIHNNAGPHEYTVIRATAESENKQ